MLTEQLIIYLPAPVWGWYTRIAKDEKRDLSNVLRIVIEEHTLLDDYNYNVVTKCEGNAYQLRISGALLSDLSAKYPLTSVHEAARMILVGYYEKFKVDVKDMLFRAFEHNQTQIPKL
jgi:hypothetical protein